MQSICSHFSCDMACTFPQWQLLFVDQDNSPSQPCISCFLPLQKLGKLKFHFPNQFFDQKCLLSITLSNEIKAKVYQELLRKICFLLIGLVVFPSGSEGKECTCSARDLGLFPSERHPGKRNSFPLQYSCLKNPMDRRAWRAIVHAHSLQSCLTLCDPMGHSPPGSSVHRIRHARILQQVAMPSSIVHGSQTVRHN